MNTSIIRSAGMAAGILVGLFIAFVIIRYANSNKKYKTEYDERQTKVRGDAYRFAFYTLMICEAIAALIEMAEIPLPFESFNLHFGNIFIGCIVLSAICIWKDAYWGLNNNRRVYGIVFVVCGLLNAFPVVMTLLNSQQESMSFPYVSLMACIMLLTVGAELLIKQLVDKRNGLEEN